MRSDAVGLRSVRVDRAPHSRVREVDLANVTFSSVFSDHMFVAQFRNGSWGDGVIRPFGPLLLSPSISALHYGVCVFDGMKAYKSPSGQPLLFRPADTARRLQRSAARLAMQPVPTEMFLHALRELVSLDREWIPPGDQGALYIRPLLFSDDSSIRVKPADQFQFIILTFPFSAYYAGALDLMVSQRYVRACPGGTGDVKAAGNYAASLLADLEANAMGFNSTLWVDALERRFVEECGVMNVFFVIGDEVITPPLGGTILGGMTRDSVMTLLRDGGYRVKEERVSVEQLIAAHAQGRLRECFGTGTAATVSHVRRIRYKDQIVEMPPVDQREVGPPVRHKLLGIMTGRDPDPHGWVETVR